MPPFCNTALVSESSEFSRFIHVPSITIFRRMSEGNSKVITYHRQKI